MLTEFERTNSAMWLLDTVSAIGTALGPTLGGALVSWTSMPTASRYSPTQD